MTLVCGTCGIRFQGKQGPEHDDGYGDCPKCVKWLHKLNEAEWNELRGKVADALNAENGAKFLAMEPELQRGIMLKMIEDGIIDWTIKATEPIRIT